MDTFSVFYTTYSTGDSVDSMSPVNMRVPEIIEALPRCLRANEDFFGIGDSAGVTLQFMRGNGDRVWMEIPAPEKQGSYGKHATIELVLELIKRLPSSFEQLKADLTFQSWTGGDTSEKPFAIPGEQIKPLAEGHGACFATDMITVGDRGVGYMYREAPDFEADSGWRFFSGHESEEYVNDPGNTQIYDVNTIANYDPDIIPLLSAPLGAAFERSEHGKLAPVQDG